LSNRAFRFRHVTASSRDQNKRGSNVRLHLEKIGVKLTQLSKKQADYIGVPAHGTKNPEHYRY